MSAISLKVNRENMYINRTIRAATLIVLSLAIREINLHTAGLTIRPWIIQGYANAPAPNWSQ